MRKVRRFIVLFTAFLLLTSLKAQTLYWVGGNGNFNDPRHWSYTSGGPSANQAPGIGNQVIFDEASASQDFYVNFTAHHQVAGVQVLLTSHSIRLTGNAGTELQVAGNFSLNHRTIPEFKTRLIFSNTGSTVRTANFGKRFLTTDVEFRAGEWDLKDLITADEHTVTFIAGKIHIDHTRVQTGSFIANTGNVSFEAEQALIRVKNRFILAPNTVFETNHVTFDVPNHDPSRFVASPGFTSTPSRKFIGNGGNNVLAACGITLSSTPVTCFGNSDGKLILTVDLSCALGSYTLTWNNPGPIGTLCADVLPVTQVINVTSGVHSFTFSGMPACPFSYDVSMVDGSNVFYYSNQANIPGPGAINLNPQTVTNPSCFGVCDGVYIANLSNGTPPYNVILTPPTGPVQNFPNQAVGTKTFSGLCGGVQSFSVTDASGCSRTFSLMINQPGTLVANPVTTSITCNGLSNGAFAVSPTGGNTGGYTVNFSTGASQVIASGGTANSTNLPMGAISATVTDTKGCTAIANSNITQPSVLAVTPSQTNVLCNGFNTGAASVLVSGGTPTYAFSWSPASGTSSLITGLTAGTQTVTITDRNSCTQTVGFNITEPSAIVLTPTHTNVVCSGSCTGVASVAATGGVGSFIYTWVAAGNNTIASGSANSISNLCAGTYTVFVRDTPNDCTTSAIINITQPPALTLTAASQSITCYNANDGSATITATGGNGAPFTYNWLPFGQTASVVTGLAPRTYTAVARDAMNCETNPIQVTIIEPTGLVPNVTTTIISCNVANRACDGAINAQPTGGTLPYSYSLVTSSSTITSAPPYTGLCANTYTLIVKDASGCPQQSVATLNQPQPIVPTISTSSINCFGESTGGLTGNSGTGGTGPYTLTWMTPNGPASGPALTNQPAGNYTLTVTDSRTCTAQATATIVQPSSITVAVNSSSISCYSSCNGVLNATVSGGMGGYTYTWTNAQNAVVSSGPSATGLCPGSYTLTVRDVNLCVKRVVGVVQSPAPITMTVNTTPVNCFGDSNGSATVTIAGGTPSYTYSFNSAPTVTNTTGMLSGQPAGPYTVTALDNAGCVETATFAINSPTALAAAITGTGSCNVCTGTIVVSPSFGTSPYTISWASSLGGSFPSSQTLTNLCPGDYTATVTDARNCVIQRTITLTQVISIQINVGANSILCNGAATGSATASATGGTGSYSYSWSPGPSTQTNAILSGVTANTYTVKVTDTSSPTACSHTAAVTLNQPPAITVTSTQTNVSCYGMTDASIITNVSGGTTGVPTPYSYTWSPGGQNTSSITGIGAGVYTLNVLDGNLCPAVKTVSITQPSSITIVITSTNPAGCIPSLANGQICAAPSGGSGSGYTYTLSPQGTTNTTGCFTGLGGGAYSIIVKDGSGCSSSTITTLSPPSGPALAVSATSVACNGYSTAVASATATGTSPFTFSWTPAVTNTVSSATTSSANNIPAGVYYVTALDPAGCVATRSVQVNQAPAYTVSPVVSNLRCNNLHTGSITVFPSGGSPGYSYTWTAPPTVTFAGQGTQAVTGLAAGVYTLTLSDTHTCNTPYTFTVTQPPAITVTANTYSLQCFNVCTGSIVANAIGGTGFINYSWAPVAGTTGTITNLCANTGANPSYTLTATDANTCSVVRTYTITQPSALTNTVSVQVASCSNSCNAVATQTASGGTPGYNYSWSSSPATTTTLGSLCGGTYTAIVSDANGCSTSRQFTVTPPAPLNVTLTPSNPLCNAACNGSIATQISGAQGSVTFTWLPAGSGQNPTNLCATPNPVYTLTARDQNFCSVTAVTTLTNPPAMVATVTGTNPLCHNDVNGKASVSVVNSVGALSYTWTPSGPPPQTAQTATGLASGPHTVIVRDANSCLTSQTFTLQNPSQIVVNTSANPASCSQSNGDITANPSGGTPGSPVPYTYTWTGTVGSSSVVSNIPAGSYTVRVADGLGCNTSSVVLLSNSSGPNTIPISSTSITCHAYCSGSASVDVLGIQGGTGPYDVSWLSPISATVNPAINLCAGMYTARIEDATGCIGFTTTTISEPPALTITPVSSPPLCPGICNGSITIHASGGNAPYTYSWMPGPATTSAITGLCAGDYTVMVGYNSVCSETALINLPDQSSITIVPTVTNNVCFGTCKGIVNIAVSGGSSPYVAGWNTGTNGLSIDQLCNGSYSVIVTDNNGCSNTATAAITSGAPMTSSTTVVEPACGICNGSASVTASGGTGGLTYNWSNSATTPSISNLCAGIYQVVITDALTCSMTHTVIVNNSNGIAADNYTVQQIPCSGSCVGAATVSAVGGTQPITYNWVSPAVSNSVITGLCPGTYYVQMSDANSCVRIGSVTINSQITLSVSPFVYQPSCGATNGSISIVIAGGTPSYNIVWNPPAGQTTSLTNLSAGVYAYTVTESGPSNCAVSNSITVSNANGPAIAATHADVNCYGACTGSIAATATGTNSPFNYDWSTGSSAQQITNLCKGVVTLTVTDAVGCKSMKSFTITEGPEMFLGLGNVKNPVCFGDCNGSINLVPSGGTLPYTYTWSAPGITSNPAGGLCDGVYQGSVIDAKGCVLASPSYTVKSASSISITVNTSNSSCSSATDGSISVNASGGNPVYQYVWKGPASFAASTQNISNLSVGSYTLDVSDNLGCSRDSVISVKPSFTVVAKAGNDRAICPETGTVLLVGTSDQGANYKWFALQDRSRALSSTSELLVKNITEPASFILVATSSVQNCYSEDTVSVGVHALPTIDAGRDYLVPVYSTVKLGGYPLHWGGVASLTWSPAADLSDPHAEHPVASNTVNVVYTLTVTDLNGCTVSDSAHVFLFPKLNVPSGFTPNGDGKNDLWIIDYIDQFPGTTVEIYNRWGDKLFNSDPGYPEPFDGKYKGNDLPVGTYYYIINLNHPGYPKPITGPLTLFR